MKKHPKKMIKFYEYNLGNNRLVGNDASGVYTDEVPRWYKLQAEMLGEQNHHRLAGEEPEPDEEDGHTFWQDKDYEASERMEEDEWSRYVDEHDIFLPSQAQSDIESLREQGLID